MSGAGGRTAMKSFLGLPYVSKGGDGRDFPGGPVVNAPRFHCRGRGFDPCSEN